MKKREYFAKYLWNSYFRQHEVTFGNVLDLWMENNRIRLKGGTINKYQSIIDTQIMPTLGAVPIDMLSATLLNTFLKEKLENGRQDKKGGLSASYVQSMSIILNAAIKFGAAEGICAPLKTPIYKPSLSKKDLRILSLDEQKCLEQYLIKNITPTNLGILLSLYTGMRIGEICALTWNDIDFSKNVIKVRHTIARVMSEETNSQNITMLILDTPKTKASVRDIPISSTILPYMVMIKNMSGSLFVTSETSDFLCPRTFEYRFQRILERCEIEPVNYHVLRHTFATRCVESSVDIKSLSEILGHANVGITLNTYVHSSLEMKRKQIEKMNIWLKQ